MKSDIRASFVVFLVALPLCLGISLASGAPLFAGILAGIIGGIVVGIISSSQTSVSGPAAGLTIVVLAGVSSLQNFYLFTAAIVIAGVLQLILGLVGAGRIGGYFPNSVIKGMLAAMGLILILKQIPHAIGFDVDYMGDESFFQTNGQNTFTTLINSIWFVSWPAATISSFSLVVLSFWNRMIRRGFLIFEIFPAPVFVVGGAVLFNEFIASSLFGTQLDASHLVNLPIEEGLASFFTQMRLPDFSGFLRLDVYRLGVTLAIVATLETLLSIEAVDRIDPKKNITDKSHELLAQGIGNILAGMVGALPVTSVVIRSSAGISAGSKTKLTTIFHGVWLLVSVLCCASLLEKIPLAALAAILIYIGYQLAHPRLFKEIRRTGKQQFLPFLITIIAILFTDLLTGIVIGMAAGFLFVIKASYKRSVVVVNDGSNYLIQFVKDVSFLNKPEISQALSTVPEGAHLIVDGTGHLAVDEDVVVLLREFIEASKDKKITVEVLRSNFAIHSYFKSEPV